MIEVGFDRNIFFVIDNKKYIERKKVVKDNITILYFYISDDNFLQTEVFMHFKKCIGGSLSNSSFLCYEERMYNRIAFAIYNSIDDLKELIINADELINEHRYILEYELYCGRVSRGRHQIREC